MNPAIAVPLAFYGGLAAAAFGLTWRDPCLRGVGIMLALGFLLSNVMHFTLPVTALPGPYTFIEVAVALAAYWCFTVSGSRPLIALVAVNLASIGFNVAFSLHEAPTPAQIFRWELATNICFAVECLMAIGLGVAHGYRTGSFRRRLRPGRAAAQPHAARVDDSLAD